MPDVSVTINKEPITTITPGHTKLIEIREKPGVSNDWDLFKIF